MNEAELIQKLINKQEQWHLERLEAIQSNYNFVKLVLCVWVAGTIAAPFIKLALN